MAFDAMAMFKGSEVGKMTPLLFVVSVVMSFVGSFVLAKLFVWPWLKTLDRQRALVALVVPHMFFRVIGLSFLVPGVVSGFLPAAFALPAAYGDLVAGILAVIAVVLLARRAVGATVAVWLFNIWGALDLLFAMFQGPHTRVNPGALGAAFFIPTAIVPPMLVTHFLIFGLLVGGAHRASRTTAHQV
jgi:hypothetical protein